MGHILHDLIWFSFPARKGYEERNIWEREVILNDDQRNRAVTYGDSFLTG